MTNDIIYDIILAVTSSKKLLERIRRLPPDMDFGEVQVILEFLGYSHTGGKGSHFVFSKKGAWPITIVKEGGQRVKRVYLKKVVAVLDLEETDEA